MKYEINVIEKKKYVNDWYVFFKVMVILKCMYISFFFVFLDSN